MRGLAFGWCLFSLCVMVADQSQKGKRSDVQVIEAKGHRVEGNVSVDGKLKITTEKPLRGLVLSFDFVDHDNAILTTEREQISEDVLNAGDTLSFHAETFNPPGAIKFKMRAYDTSEKELRIVNPGPFLIE